MAVTRPRLGSTRTDPQADRTVSAHLPSLVENRVEVFANIGGQARKQRDGQAGVRIGSSLDNDDWVTQYTAPHRFRRAAAAADRKRRLVARKSYACGPTQAIAEQSTEGTAGCTDAESLDETSLEPFVATHTVAGRRGRLAPSSSARAYTHHLR